MKRRILSAIATAILIACLVPGAAWAADVAVSQAATDQNGNALLESMERQSATKPDGFDEDTANPYGTEEGEVVTLLEKTELFSFVSSNLNNKKKMNKTLVGEGTSSGSVSLAQQASSWIPDDKVLSYMQGVSFDPLGGNRRNYVGLVGYDASSKSMKVYVINADSATGTSRAIQEFTIATGDAASWVEKVNLDTVDSKNFFQITAGDYDGDGRESLVVYCGSMTSSADGLTEIAWDGSSWITTAVETKDLLNSTWLNNKLYDSHKAFNKDDWADSGNRLCVALDSGDVNGDGVDDLVVVSAAGKLSNSYTTGGGSKGHLGEACIPRLAVAFGSKSKAADGSVTSQTVDSLSKKSVDVKDDNDHTMAAPGVSVGDIDGDGTSEIAVAGFMNYWGNQKKDGSGKNYPVYLQDSKIAFAYYNCDDGSLRMGGSLQELSGNDVSPINKLGESVRSNESAWQQFSVECVAFDGARSQEYLFLNGYVYKLSGSSLACVQEAKKDPFTSYKNKVDKNTSGGIGDYNENFVYSAAVGNLYGNDDGKEAICLTVGYKENKADDYSFLRVTIRKTSDTTYTQVGNTTWDVVNNNGDTLGEKLNCIVVAIDNDRDSVVGKYVGKGYAYSDPNVVAFLQAAPYFGELDPGNSSTTYSYTESYTKGTGKSTELSYNVGATASISAGAVTASVAAGRACEMTDEYAESRTTEYVTTFEASEQNQVIVRRTLIYNYNYQVMNAQGEFTSDDVLFVQVPQYPVMASMSQDQYNEFAQAFNAKYGTAKAGRPGEKNHTLDVISDAAKTKYHLNNEGNPFGYADNPGEYAGGVDLSNNQWMQLSYAVGTTQQECTTSLEESQTHTASDGLYMNMSIEVSADILGVVEVSAGVEAGYEKLVGKISSTSRMTATSTGGAVQNLSADLAEYGYGFHWKLVGWKGGKDLFNGVLFVGYAVRGVTAPVNAVEDLAATYHGKTDAQNARVALAWTSPEVTEGRGSIAGFKVYRKTGDEYAALTNDVYDVANAGEGSSLTYTADVSAYEDNEATFVVRSVAADGGHSLYSNEAYCLFALSDKEAQELVSKTKAELEARIGALEAALEGGQTEAIKKAVDELTAAYKEADALLAADLAGADAQIRSELEDELAQTRRDLQGAIAQVQANLDQAIAELNRAIEEGDKANTEELQKKADALTEAYEAADALLELRMAGIEESITDLGRTMVEANAALRKEIDLVQANLDAAKKELSEAISAGDAATEQALRQEIEDLKRELEEAKQANEKAIESVPMYRLYNEWSGEHLYTTDPNEVGTLQTLGWVDEGMAWRAPKKSETPVFRLYNRYSGDHHYTASRAEYDWLGSLGWTREGVGFYSAGTDGVPVYRLFNQWLEQGTHLYTTNALEYDALGSIGWAREEVAFYGA